MQVKRIVANISAENLTKAKAFYADIFGLDLIMDLGFIRTYSAGTQMPTQLSIASEGGSGAPVPDFSFEVDDVETALTRVQATDFAIEYGPVTEPFGVRRFFVRDPFGKLINVLQHI